MRLSLLVLSLLVAGAVAKPKKHQHVLSKEDEDFWARFLEQNDEFSLEPTPQPVNPPTPDPPTPQPVEPPTPEPPTDPPRVDCDVQVTLDCTLDSDSSPCDQVEVPSTPSCAVGSSISSLTFSYQGSNCASQDNQQGVSASCEDASSIMFSDPVSVQCVGPNGEPLDVEPSSVPPGSPFTVSAENDLPASIDCRIFDVDDSPLQRNTIDTSGTVRLDLADSFGAFTVEGCARDGDSLSCLEGFRYSIDMRNVGTVEMQVTVVQFTFEDNEFDLFGAVTANPIQPGDNTIIEAFVEVNICNADVYNAEANVEADPPDGDSCQDDDSYRVRVPALPPPAPTQEPTMPPSARPTPEPTVAPTTEPTFAPTTAPTLSPTPGPTSVPSLAPTQLPPCNMDIQLSCELESGDDCTNIEPRGTDCIETFIYTVEVKNNGPVVMEVTRLDFALNAATSRLLDVLEVNPLDPEESTSVSPRVDIDVCAGGSFTAIAIGEGNGNACSDNVEYEVDIPASPPTAATPPPVSSEMPSTAPSPQPTMEPEVDCEVDVTLDCFLENGSSCDALEPPTETSCSIGDAIESITLSYQGTTCSQAGNRQGSEASCQDVEPILFTDAVSISCFGVDGENLRIEPDTVQPQGLFAVTGRSGRSLPRKIDCSIFDVDRTELQSIIIDTSGAVSVPLDLSDEFGSLHIESCDRGGSEISCFESLGYEIVLENVGTVDMSVTKVDFTFNGMPFSFLSNVQPNRLPPGESSTLKPNVEINVCTTGTYIAAVAVEADPPNGQMCQDDDQFVLAIDSLPRPPPTESPTAPPVSIATPAPRLPTVEPTNSPTMEPQADCLVEVGLDCNLPDGSPCDTIDPPETLCSVETDIDAISLSYQGTVCSSDGNQQGSEAFCEDAGSFDSMDPVSVECLGVDGENLRVEPQLVDPGAILSISGRSNRSLPRKLDCKLFNINGTQVQQNIIDTSGDVRLRLTDQFGALRLESCTLDEQELTCLEEFGYEVTIENVGPVDMDVTVVDFTLNGDTKSVLSEVQPSVIAPGDSVVLEPTVTVNTCMQASYDAVVNIQADPPNGMTCQDDDRYVIQVSSLPPPPPTPSPTNSPSSSPSSSPSVSPMVAPTPAPVEPRVPCNVEAELECFLVADGRPCDEIEPRSSTTCSIQESIDSLLFTVQGSPCVDGSNRQFDEAVCEDFENIPLADPVLVECRADDSDGSALEVEPASLLPGETFFVKGTEGLGLPNKISCIIRSEDGTDLQRNIIDTSAAVPLDLKDEFGALRLDSCDRGGEELSCFAEFAYQVGVENTGTVELNITTLELTLGQDVANLLGVVENPIAGGETVSISPRIQIDTCVAAIYEAEVRLEANPRNGDSCEDSDSYIVFISMLPPPPPVTQPTPIPTLEPTSNPSAEPSASPSSVPSTEPSPAPSLQPSSSPSAFPSSSPSTPPSSAPSPPEGDCDVELGFDCVTPDGGDCIDIEPPTSRDCRGEDITVIAFSYQNLECDPSANGQGDSATCVDEGDLVDGPVGIACFTNDGGLLTVEPSTVSPSGTFVITSPAGRPLTDTIECQILDEDGETLQANTIDTSGSAPINLGDKFGALQLETCDDTSCVETLCYNIDVRNVGDIDLDVTSLDFTFNGIQFDLEPEITDPIEPGQQQSLQPKFAVSICDGQSYSAAVDVTAEPPNGDICQDAQVNLLSFSAAPPPGTDAPVAPPTPLPTAPPTPSPTLAPIQSPVFPPTEEMCTISVAFDCIVAGNSTNTGKSCEAPDVGIVPCMERPTAATMLFNGGGCEQSDNRQFLKFTCEDFGTVPTQLGEEAHILVTDIKGKDITYFEGIVRVGDFYNLNDGGERFESDQLITISSPDQSEVLQQAQYHSSCSSNLELKNRFGANQLVAFFNEQQGNVTCFTTFDLALTIEVPVTVFGDSVTLTSMTAVTNFAGFIDLTDQVAGQTASPEGNVVVTLEGTIDLTIRQEYIAMFTIEGIANPSGALCTGTSTGSFVAGEAVSPTIPTIMPTQAPTLSAQPTMDVATSACSLEAETRCEIMRDGRPVGSCASIDDPRGVSCTGDAYPTSLTFVYLPGPQDPAMVTIVVEGDGTSSSFTAGPGEIVTFDGDFEDDASVEIVEVGQSFDIDTSCDEGPSQDTGTQDTMGSQGTGGLQLGQQFGVLQLVGFRNELGYFSSIFETRLTYSVRNGPIRSTLQSVTIDSPFFESPVAVLDAPFLLSRGQTVVVFEDNLVIDAAAKFEQGDILDFTVDVSAVAQQSGLSCSTTDTFSF